MTRASPRCEDGDADAGDPRLPHGARSAHRHQGEREDARPPPRLHGLCRRQALPATARSPASFAIVGLFTSGAFTRSGAVASRSSARRSPASPSAPASIPLSHSGKALLNILEHYPRTELFQAEKASLYESAMAILQLEERPRVRALIRRDRFDRFVSVLVFVPRDRYTSDLRERIGLALARFYDGRVSAFFPDFSHDAPDARAVHHRAQSGRGAGSCAGRRRGDDPRHRPHLRGRPRRRAERRLSAGPRRRDLCCDYGERLRLRLSRGLQRRRMRVARHRDRRSGSRPTTSRRASSGGRACPRREVVLQLPPSRRPDPAVAARSASWKISASPSSTSAPTASPGAGARRSIVHDMTLALSRRRRPSTSAQRGGCTTPCLAVWHDKVDNDGFNALVLLAAGLDLAPGGAAAHHRAAICGRRTFLTRIDYFWGALQRNPARRGAARRVSSPRASRRDVKQRERARGTRRPADRGGAGGGEQPRRRHHPARLPRT